MEKLWWQNLRLGETRVVRDRILPRIADRESLLKADRDLQLPVIRGN